MSKSSSKPTIKTQILECLEDGEKHVSELYKVVSGKEASIRAVLSSAKKSGEIETVDHGRYRLPEPQDTPAEAKNSRGESENTETINKMLNLYDKLLDAVAGSIEKEDWDEIVDKIEAIKSLRWLGATVDQLMKRWYLVHRGYDTNTRQAQEDAKQKTADREKADQKNAPPEDRVVEVGHFHPDMEELWNILPDAEKEKRTV